MNPTDGGPAFPRACGSYKQHTDDASNYGRGAWVNQQVAPVDGMSVRTWLAGIFAAAIFANPACKKMNVDCVALKAYKAADAMLAEGEKNDATP